MPGESEAMPEAKVLEKQVSVQEKLSIQPPVDPLLCPVS